MKLFHVLAACVPAALLAGLAAPLWAEGNPAAGKQKTWTCEGCHGIPDYRTAYPDVKALQDYKSGARKNTTMRAIAARLSDQDMADIAAYYAGGGGN